MLFRVVKVLSMKVKYFVFILLFLTGCSTTNNFSDFYNDEGLSPSEYISLKKDENVLVIETGELSKRLNEYAKKGYVVIGSSHFKGQWCPRSMAIDVAKEKGATVVILSSIHLDDVEYTYAIPVQQSHTVYHQGNMSSTGYTSGNIGGYNGINYSAVTNQYASFSGTSTYYTTSYFTNSYIVGYFEQIAFFLAKKID